MVFFYRINPFGWNFEKKGYMISIDKSRYRLSKCCICLCCGNVDVVKHSVPPWVVFVVICSR